MRKLKFHEKKLLKKVNFFEYKKENGHRELEVIRRYHLQDPKDYHQFLINRVIVCYVETSQKLFPKLNC